MLAGLWIKGNPLTQLVRMQIGVATVEYSTEVSQKSKNRSVIWATNFTPEYIFKKKTQRFEKIYAPNVHSSVTYSRQNIETI